MGNLNFMKFLKKAFSIVYYRDKYIKLIYIYSEKTTKYDKLSQLTKELQIQIGDFVIFLRPSQKGIQLNV